MSETVVSEEMAQRLRKLGYPQDNFPQLVYADMSYDMLTWRLELVYWEHPIVGPNWVAAPSPDQAIMWVLASPEWTVWRGATS